MTTKLPGGRLVSPHEYRFANDAYMTRDNGGTISFYDECGSCTGGCAPGEVDYDEFAQYFQQAKPESRLMDTASITLLYTCPECGEKSEQWLNNLVENGTHTCDCGEYMVLDDKVRVKA